ICDFSFEYGMVTESWCAEFALRRRVRRSAIGSVIVMGLQPSLIGVSEPRLGADLRRSWLPAALGHAGELAAVRHLAHADAAEPELAVHRVRTSAPLAPRVGTDLELRGPGSLLDQGGLRHCQSSLKGKPRRFRSERPSSSVVAVVTTVMSMPRTRSILS